MIEPQVQPVDESEIRPVITKTVYYLESNGMVVGAGQTCDPEGGCPPGQDFLIDVTARPFFDYVEDGEVLARPTLNIQVAGAKLKGVPAGATLSINDEEYTADGTTITIDFPYAGLYRLKVAHWPYLDWSHTIDHQA